jgi:hypothetical protein
MGEGGSGETALPLGMELYEKMYGRGRCAPGAAAKRKKFPLLAGISRNGR